MDTSDSVLSIVCLRVGKVFVFLLFRQVLVVLAARVRVQLRGADRALTVHVHSSARPVRVHHLLSLAVTIRSA